MSDRRKSPWRWLPVGLVLAYLLYKFSGVGPLLFAEAPPTRAELRELWESYFLHQAATSEELGVIFYRDLDHDLRLVLGEELPWEPKEPYGTLDFLGLWPHVRDLPLEDRLRNKAEISRKVRTDLGEASAPPDLPLLAYLSVEDVFSQLTTWSPADEEDRVVLRATLTLIVDTLLDHPDWPSWGNDLQELQYAVAWLDQLGAPLDAPRQARIRALLDSRVDGGWHEEVIQYRWGGDATVYALALMKRVGVPEQVDLTAVRRRQARSWQGMDDLESWHFPYGLALLVLDELEASLTAE